MSKPLASESLLFSQLSHSLASRNGALPGRLAISATKRLQAAAPPPRDLAPVSDASVTYRGTTLGVDGQS